MRQSLVLLILCGFSYSAFTQNSEEDNVKKAIIAKFDAWQKRDLAAGKASWHQDPGASVTFASRNGYNTVKGWDSLSKGIEKEFAQAQNPPAAPAELENFNIKVDGNMAIAEYDRTNKGAVPQPDIFPYVSSFRFHDIEMLVKENGQWKTHTRIVTAPDSYTGNAIHNAETDINNAGYELLSLNKFNEAIEVFKLNVKLFPNSWNVYDSLGEAYAAAGKKKEAIENYEKSIKLNPASTSGPEALAKLKK